jgi:3-oxoacyl-[acyl-carrier protein] reductase
VAAARSVRRFAAHWPSGHHVYVHANQRRDEAQTVAAAIIAAGGSAEMLVFDVTDGEAGCRIAAADRR